MSDRLDPAEVAALIERTDLVALIGVAVPLRRQGPEWRGPCPWCGGANTSSKFRVRPARRHWNCFLCDRGGDAIGFLEAYEGLAFRDAVERLGGPRADTLAKGTHVVSTLGGVSDGHGGGKGVHSSDTLGAPAITMSPGKAGGEVNEGAATLERARRIWSDAARDGDGVARYLRGRGLFIAPPASLRFVSALPYWGFADAAAEEVTRLGAFPAVVGYIRGPSGGLIGLHRTWLDPDTFGKLRPPGDRLRNSPKKIMGRHWGGHLPLTQAGDTLVIGEGYETTLSVLSRVGTVDGSGAAIAYWSGVSLGNIAGGSAGPSLPHPETPERKVPSSRPDPNRPGLQLPPWARRLVLLGDGDSDPHVTRSRLRCAARRFRGADRTVAIAWAAPGKDFNDMLQDAGRRRPALAETA